MSLEMGLLTEKYTNIPQISDSNVWLGLVKAKANVGALPQ